jgi:cell division protein FtsQ
VTISGIAELTADEVLTTGSIDTRKGLPFVDAAAIRTKIAELPLVADVKVRKLYPSDLIVSLSERKPFALWQRDGEVSVVSRDGVVIEKAMDARFVGLPLAVGEGANRRVDELAAIYEAAGALRERLKAGVLVGERRWNLKFDNNVDVRLPEVNPLAAVRRLVALQHKYAVIDREVLVVDLRDDDRVTLRLTPEAAAVRREEMKSKLGAAKKGSAT